METAAIMAAVNGGIQILNLLIPELQRRMAAGEVSAADQEAVRAKFDEFKKNLPNAFSGPEWEVGDPS